MQKICVFCGSKSGVNSNYTALSRQLGQALAARQIGLVYGGGRVGLMGEIADATVDAGGSVVGIIPKALADYEVAHQRVTELHLVDTMHQRKALMAELSDGFIAMPGGFGTLEELFEVVTWAQLGIHNKPIGLLNIDGYYDALITFLDHSVEMGFISPLHRGIIVTATTPDAIIDALFAYERGFSTSLKWG